MTKIETLARAETLLATLRSADVPKHLRKELELATSGLESWIIALRGKRARVAEVNARIEATHGALAMLLRGESYCGLVYDKDGNALPPPR